MNRSQSIALITEAEMYSRGSPRHVTSGGVLASSLRLHQADLISIKRNAWDRSLLHLTNKVQEKQ